MNRHAFTFYIFYKRSNEFVFFFIAYIVINISLFIKFIYKLNSNIYFMHFGFNYKAISYINNNRNISYF